MKFEGADHHLAGACLDWAERGQIVGRKLFASRDHVPLWPRDPAKVRQVILRYLNGRLNWHGTHDAALAAMPDDAARLKFLSDLERSKLPELTARLDRLCREYVQLKREAGAAAAADARVRTLAVQIKSLDGFLVCVKSGSAGRLVRLIQLYFGAGLDSVGVGLELGITPVAARQYACRLNKIARVLAFE